jgi:hypothetical protein
MITLIGNGVYPVVFGSRILGGGALKGGMPMYKYVANRLLTLTQNLLMGQKLSEYHTGYRAYAPVKRVAIVWTTIKLARTTSCSTTRSIGQICWKGYEIAEITCPTKYFDEASSINFSRSMTYGSRCVAASACATSWPRTGHPWWCWHPQGQLRSGSADTFDAMPSKAATPPADHRWWPWRSSYPAWVRCICSTGTRSTSRRSRGRCMVTGHWSQPQIDYQALPREAAALHLAAGSMSMSSVRRGRVRSAHTERASVG